MAINATNESAHYELVPSGTFIARCYSMIHIGTVSENFKGETKQMNKVRISWELPTEKKEFKQGEGLKPYSISKEFTLSMNEKSNLRKFLEGWRGAGFTDSEAKIFDITKLLGVPCMVSIIHRTSSQGRKYADISSASALIKGMQAPPQFNPSFEFSFDPFDEHKFKQLPEFLKKKIATSQEYFKVMNPHHEEGGVFEPNNNNDDDDLPF